MTFQPQFSLSRLQVTGFEALARFPGRTADADTWFARARAIGLGPQLEAAAVANAVRAGADRPGGTVLAVNVSPGVLTHPLFHEALPEDLTGLEIEITEHEAVADVLGSGRVLAALRERGARIAIDDVGAGHSGLRRIRELMPDVLKLDRLLVDGVAGDTAQQALVRAVVDLAGTLGALVCAEGVETVPDLLVLGALDVDIVQGWLIGRGDTHCVADPPAVAEICRASLDRLLAPGPTGADLDREGVYLRLEDVLGLLAAAEDVSTVRRWLDRSAAVLGCLDVRLLRCGDPCDGAACDEATRMCRRERRIVPDAVPGLLHVPVTAGALTPAALVFHRHPERAWTSRQVRGARLVAAVLSPVLDRLAALDAVAAGRGAGAAPAPVPAAGAAPSAAPGPASSPGAVTAPTQRTAPTVTPEPLLPAQPDHGRRERRRR